MLKLSDMKFFIRTFVVVVATLPFFANSAVLPSLIVCDPLSNVPCTFSSFVGLANTIIKFFIILGTSVFTIMFMLAGFEYLTANGNSGKISKAHSYFFDSIIGFVIMLAAWLFVDFILSALLKSGTAGDYRLLGK